MTEVFELRLRSFGEDEAVIGRRSSINITVLPNDDEHGVFIFAEDSLDVFMSESQF